MLRLKVIQSLVDFGRDRRTAADSGHFQDWIVAVPRIAGRPERTLQFLAYQLRNADSPLRGLPPEPHVKIIGQAHGNALHTGSKSNLAGGGYRRYTPINAKIPL